MRNIEGRVSEMDGVKAVRVSLDNCKAAVIIDPALQSPETVRYSRYCLALLSLCYLSEHLRMYMSKSHNRKNYQKLFGYFKEKCIKTTVKASVFNTHYLPLQGMRQ